MKPLSPYYSQYILRKTFIEPKPITVDNINLILNNNNLPLCHDIL